MLSLEVNITYETLTDQRALMLFLSAEFSICQIRCHGKKTAFSEIEAFKRNNNNNNSSQNAMLPANVRFVFLFSADEGFDMYKRPPIYKQQGKRFPAPFPRLNQ